MYKSSNIHGCSENIYTVFLLLSNVYKLDGCLNDHQAFIERSLHVFTQFMHWPPAKICMVLSFDGLCTDELKRFVILSFSLWTHKPVVIYAPTLPFLTIWPNRCWHNARKQSTLFFSISPPCLLSLIWPINIVLLLLLMLLMLHKCDIAENVCNQPFTVHCSLFVTNIYVCRSHVFSAASVKFTI